MRFLSLFIFLVILLNSVQPQPVGVRPHYINPVDIPMRLAGTFGELRANHFHGGIDIKTQQVEGKPIYAIADGFISRINVSPVGYGKSLYIEHSDGKTSVYAHLREFNPQIASFVLKEQYQRESFAVELYPKRNEFQVKQGDLIAYSGNSGSSEGPHLHFEIRETALQIPVNPLDFGFTVKDFIRPTISLLKVYPHGSSSSVNSSQQAKVFELAGWGPKYRLRETDTLKISAGASFGIMTHDLLNDESNKNGVKSIELFIDSALVSGVRMLRIPFDEGRYINSLCDFYEYKIKKRRIVRTYVQPGNKLSVYLEKKQRGIFLFEPGKLYNLKYVVTDFYNNESVLRFLVQGVVPPAVTKMNVPVGEKVIWNTDYEYSNKGIGLKIPANCLYDTLYFVYSSKESGPAFLSAFHRVHSDTEAMHTSYTLRIKPDTIPVGKTDKLCMVKVDEKGSPASADGKFENGWVVSQLRSFGTYSIMLDTTAPSIKPINISPGKNIAKQKDIRIKISDNLSGIAKYKGKLNNKWILMEYDPKNNLLTYAFDDRLKPGLNIFELEVNDARFNSRIIKMELFY